MDFTKQVKLARLDNFQHDPSFYEVPISPDHGSTDSDDSCSPVSFEGPEKNLEIDFVPGVGHSNGCRKLTRNQLDMILKEAQCLILSTISNEYLDAYILSESSLFVYPYKMIFKTCGTTTLLKCIPLILEFIKALKMEVEWLCYSRKNFSFPENQIHPHTSFYMEVQYLNTLFEGSAYVLGPVTQDHWLVYVSDNCDRPIEKSTDKTLHILMQDLHPDVASLFYKSFSNSSKDMTKKSNINHLVPGAVIDDFAFDPCGYSMNGIFFDSYYTIHITPESHCSYASWETNANMESYSRLIRRVLQVFRPMRFTMTLYADQGGLGQMQKNPLSLEIIPISETQFYKRKNHSHTHFECDYVCYTGNWTLQEHNSTSLQNNPMRIVN